jgi:1-acyl-sn-glycerol-3-phosphate acyltransferase
MFKKLAILFFKWKGWKVDTNLPANLKRCVLIAAPHTSNWDFVYTIAAFGIYGLPIRFTIKKEWMRFPFSIITKPLGGIGIDRSNAAKAGERISYTVAMANLFNSNGELIIVITPEGTRSRRETWKTGFYHIAKEANVPICLGYCDYKNKIAGIGLTIFPSDYETDMKTIMKFYNGIHPKFPENFSLDKAFSIND